MHHYFGLLSFGWSSVVWFAPFCPEEVLLASFLCGMTYMVTMTMLYKCGLVPWSGVQGQIRSCIARSRISVSSEGPCVIFWSGFG